MSERRGNLPVQVRLEPKVWEAIRERIPPAGKGRSGGVAHWIRALIYCELEMGEPPQVQTEKSPRHKKRLAKLADGAVEKTAD